MIKTAIYIIEILSILQCIHCIYGTRLKVNMGLLVTIVSLWLTMEITNKYSVVFEGTFTMHSILIIYCILVFGRHVKELIINTALFLIIGTITQLAFTMIVIVIFPEDILVRTLIADVCVLIFNMLILPLIHLDKLAKWSLNKNFVLYGSCGYVLIIIIQLLIKIRIVEGINVGFYFTMIPLIICIYLLAKQWRVYQEFYEHEKSELQIYRDDKQKFAGLISKIRQRQHEINNHITAIIALHYTTKTYEELVNKQNEYCNHIVSENKFDSLLRLYNSILPGFLIDKFKNIESKGISIDCIVTVDQYKSIIPEYYLVEMLGILLDNATEAIENGNYGKKLYFEILQNGTEYGFTVRNPYQYVTSEEIETWFLFEKSSKGIDRGIGLYHLKCLCIEWNCLLVCKNLQISENNWIEFKIIIDSKGD